MGKSQNIYYQIYAAAHNNAVDLLGEAELLFKHKHYARAYFLAYTALEEISKSQHAADVYTGYSEEKEFVSSFTNHKEKILRVGWAYYEAKDRPESWVGPDLDDVEMIVVDEPLWGKRLNSLYVGGKNKFTVPSKEISKDDARRMMHICEVAIQQIVQMTEYWGHQIGTKGLMK